MDRNDSDLMEFERETNIKRPKKIRRIRKGAVLANSRRTIRKRKEHQKNLFNQRYNKSKDYEFPKVDNIDMNRYFGFLKFPEGFWMSMPSLAIYPILCLQSDFEENNWFQISQKNIAKMGVGLSVQPVII